MDCLTNQRFQLINPLQQPKQPEQSFSELKPPSLNSSLLMRGSPSNENDLVNQSAQNKFKKSLKHNDGTKGLKNKLLNMTNKQFKFHERDNNQPQKSIMKRFVKHLMQLAYVFRVNHYNQITKSIFGEKYLETEAKFDKGNYFNMAFTFFCDISIFLAILTLLIYAPLQVCFQLQNCFLLSGIIQIMILIEILIISYQPFQQQKINIMEILNTIAILISFTILQFDLNKSLFLMCLLVNSMVKLQGKLNKLQHYFSNDMSLISLFIKICLFLHQCACIWHYIGKWNFSSWITELGIEESGNFTQYCHSLYWAAANLLGIGESNIKIITEIELLYSSVVMIASCFMISYIFNQVSNIFFISDKQQMKNQLQQINSYFHARKVPSLIQYEFRKKLRTIEQNKQENQELENTLQFLTSDNQLQQWLKTKALKGCKHINQFSWHAQQYTINSMKYINYKSNTTIEQDLSLFIIENGEVQIIEYGKQIKVLKEGDSFGEFSFFSGNQVKTIFKTLTCTQVYKISQPEFLSIVMENKQDHEKYMFINHSILNKNYEVINLLCYSCNSKQHLISDCHLLNYKPNMVRLLKESQQGQQDRRKFRRGKNKLLNKVFATLANKISASIKLQEKYFKKSEESSESEENTIDFISNTDMSSNQYFSSYKDGYVKIIKNSTISSQTKKSKQQQSQFKEEVIKETISEIGSDSQFEIIDTPQFEKNNSQPSEQLVKLKIYNVDKVVEDNSHRKNNLEHKSFPTIGGCQTKGTRICRHLPDKPEKEDESQANVLSPRNTGSLKYKREQGPASLKNISKNSEDQLSLHYIRHTKNSMNSFPSRKTINKSVINKFPSKLSTITQREIEGRTTGQKTFQNPFSNAKVQFPITLEMIDLSQYTSNEIDECFEKMQVYQIYYPLWNPPNVIYAINSHQKRQQYKNKQIRET